MSTEGWTFGAEHELGDWSRDTDLARWGMKVDERDYTVMNSNGIAADPQGRSYRFGGEINTAPTDTIHGQVDQLRIIRQFEPTPTINHRSNLHIHIRVPGLKDDLEALKRVALYARAVLPTTLPFIEPIVPRGDAHERRRWRRRKVSHQTILPLLREWDRQAASTVADFHAFTAPRDKQGRPLHHLQPREAVNLRQLMDTETVEFRHFPGTLIDRELVTAFTWCTKFLQHALAGHRPEVTIALAAHYRQIIPWPEYVHWREVRYRATCLDGTNARPDAEENIRRILAGEFDDH